MAPLYRTILGDIEAQIRAGDLAPGARLPTESELAARHGVGRATAVRVLNELARSGLAVRRRRLGTFVADLRPQRDLLMFAAPETAAENALPGTHRVLAARVTRAADAAVQLPGAGGETAVTEMVRLKLDPYDRPMSIERHVLLLSAAPDLLEQDLESLVSMRYLRDRETAIGSVRVYLDPVNVTDSDAELLGVASAAAALRRRRETRDVDGTAIEAVETTVRPGSVQFFVELPYSAL